jgi:hypothetical protein
MDMTGNKKYSPVGIKAQSVWDSIFDRRNSQLHHFTIGFQKPGIYYTILPLHSRNQESVQIPGFWNPMIKWCHLDFPLIKNQESAQIPGFWNPMVKWCNWDFL